jgi:plastocyanin
MSFKQIKLFISFCLSTLIIYSCTQPAANYGGVGGGLPTHYISIADNVVSPATITVAIGSSITFLNQSGTNQTIVSDNCTSLATSTMAPQGHYFFKKDTLGTITYHSIENPSLTGSITFRP